MNAEPEFDQTHWIPLRRRETLPTHYYHAHFEELLSFLDAHYAHAFSAEQSRLISAFRRLPLDSQRLYVRLVNRKGRVFAEGQLRYPELGNPAPLLETLRAEGWIRAPDASDYDDVLHFLTRAELQRLLAPLVTGLSPSLRKGDLLALAHDRCPPDTLFANIAGRRIFVQCHADDIRYFLFLFFGHVQDGLTRFTMRDLGLVRTHDYKETYEPRYADRAEALEHWYFADRLHRMQGAGSASARRFAREAPEWPEPAHPASARARDELAWCLGRALESDGDIERALAVYRCGESPQCSERLARLLLAAGRRDEARDFLERLIDAPRNDEEALVAEDLYALKFGRKRTSQLTDELRAALCIDVDESRSGAPERAAAEWFEDRGLAAYRTENLLWRTFFGLLFWEELFDSKAATLHTEFEFLPSALVDGSFRAANREAVQSRLDLLEQPPKLRKRLLQSSTSHYGKPNGVFRWRQSMLDALFALIEHSPPAALRHMLERLCRDYRNARHGYPDLMLVDEDGVRFAEIKTDGDQLRRNQMLAMQQLRAAGFRADVVRIRWVLDPDQVYVVVDVETTGGQGTQHRVTEVGAVKLRGGEIVDRFQTLVNPQRSIPAGITRLTGITPAMVAGAPVFADIADRLTAFLEDGIFVAHNVDFDYGFLSREFRRLGRPFRYAKLCTCASMRKLYPGHKSYSLAALCAAFDIDLRSHHRALADAEAAAQLLLLVNRRRLEAVGDLAGAGRRGRGQASETSP